MLEHGGNLDDVAVRFGIPRADWLDLSTGINPQGYPAPATPTSAWHTLPSERDGLAEAAAGYFGPVPLLPVPGTQSAITWLPRLWRDAAVGIIEPTYAEHGAAWTEAGHTTQAIAADSLESVTGNFDIIVLCNPNNPDGRRMTPDRLEAIRAELASRGGWLIVDEAFADPHPETTLIGHAGTPGLVILRSLGKFFGLPGARVGFVLAPHPLLKRLQRKQGPWPITGPSRHIAAQALDDRAWQRTARERLAGDSERLHQQLEGAGLGPTGGTALFQYVPHTDARALQTQLARRGIWVRAFDEPPALRFGLPDSEPAWQRLGDALAALNQA